MPGYRQGERKLGSCWWKEGGCKGAQHNLPLYPHGQSCVGAQNPYREWEPWETQLRNAIPTHPQCVWGVGQIPAPALLQLSRITGKEQGSRS